MSELDLCPFGQLPREPVSITSNARRSRATFRTIWVFFDAPYPLLTLFPAHRPGCSSRTEGARVHLPSRMPGHLGGDHPSEGRSQGTDRSNPLPPSESSGRPNARRSRVPGRLEVRSWPRGGVSARLGAPRGGERKRIGCESGGLRELVPRGILSGLSCPVAK
jgi:hypothetical protein